MRKILIGICMLFLGCIIIYFNDGFKIIDEVVKSEDVLPMKNILVKDFFGTVEIKKSNRDNIIKSDNVEIRNINGSLKISNKRKKWFNFGSTNSKVVIEYSDDMLDIDVVDVVGDVLGKVSLKNVIRDYNSSQKISIRDLVGDINIF